MNITDFLLKLETNLEHSIRTFQTIPKNGVPDMINTYDTIQNISKKLYHYLELMKQLEYIYFSNLSINKEQFLLSFEEEANLGNDNIIWQKFKNNMVSRINVHKLKELNKKKTNLKVQSIELSKFDSCEFAPYKLSIPIIKNLKNIQPMFHWYNGDKHNKCGIYVCLSEGFYVRVPFPSVISKDDENFKVNTVPCKYETKELCYSYKKKSSEFHNTEIRPCLFVHKKEKFAKIGSVYRCAIEGFGNHNTLVSDMQKINIDDIKRILMYSLSDSLLSTFWYQNKDSGKGSERKSDAETILSNIDIF